MVFDSFCLFTQNTLLLSNLNFKKKRQFFEDDNKERDVDSFKTLNQKSLLCGKYEPVQKNKLRKVY